jgi:hypothetical protein
MAYLNPWQRSWGSPGTYPNQVPDENDAGVMEDAYRRAMLNARSPVANAPPLPPEAANLLLTGARSMPRLGGPTRPVENETPITSLQSMPRYGGPTRPAAGQAEINVGGIPFAGMSPTPVSGSRAFDLGPATTLAGGMTARDVSFETPSSMEARRTNPSAAPIMSPFADAALAEGRPQPGAIPLPGSYAQNYGPTAMPNWEAFRGNDFYDRNGNIQQSFNAPAFQGVMQQYQANQQLPLQQGTLDLQRTLRLGVPGDPTRPGSMFTDLLTANRTDPRHDPAMQHQERADSLMTALLRADPSMPAQVVQQRVNELLGPGPRSSTTALPVSPSQGTNPPLPPPPAGVAATGTPPPLGPVESPQARMYNVLANIRGQGQVPGQQRPLTRQDIANFVNSLGEPFVQENIQTLMPFMVERFGPQMLDQWFTERTSRMGQQTPDESARQAIMAAANRRNPGTVGSSMLNDRTPTGTQLNPFIRMPGIIGDTYDRVMNLFR